MKYFKLRTRTIAVITALSMIGLACSGCNPSDDSQEAGTTAENTVDQPADTGAEEEKDEGRQEEYVFVTHAVGLEYWKTHESAVIASAKALPNAVGYMVGDTSSDPSKMETLLDTLIDKGVDGIVICGVFPEVYRQAIEKAWEKGIPTCTVNATVPDSKALTHFGVEYDEYGYTMAQTLYDKLGGNAKVIVSQNMFSSADTAKQILKGIGQFEEDHDDFEVLTYLDYKGDSATTASDVASAVSANPDANGVIGCNASSGIGAATALRELGKIGELSIVCVDPDETTIEAIANDEIYATVCSNQWVGCFMAVQFMHWYNNDMLQMFRGHDGGGTVDLLPTRVDTGVYIITKDNVDQFR